MVECKHRKSFAFHSLFRKAQLDDPQKTLFLFTHEHGKPYPQSMVTMTAETFAKIWPHVKEQFENAAP